MRGPSANAMEMAKALLEVSSSLSFLLSSLSLFLSLCPIYIYIYVYTYIYIYISKNWVVVYLQGERARTFYECNVDSKGIARGALPLRSTFQSVLSLSRYIYKHLRIRNLQWEHARALYKCDGVGKGSARGELYFPTVSCLSFYIY